jgi:hypothetical protein
MSTAASYIYINDDLQMRGAGKTWAAAFKACLLL